MTSIKLALKNILRIPGRSILIGIIMSIISMSVLVSLSIQSGTEETLKNARKKLGSEVTLTVNMKKAEEQAMQNMREGKTETIKTNELTEEMANKYTKSKYVNDYDYAMEMPITTDKKVIGEDGGDNKFKLIGPATEMPKLKLVSNLKPQYQKEFKNGNKRIVEGRFYTNEDVAKKEPVAVISKNLAELNGLKLGDNITVNNVEDKDAKMNLKIIGLYEDKVQQDKTIAVPFMYRDNEIYTPLTIRHNILSKDQKNSKITSANYFLKDPKNIEAFKNEVKDSKLDLEKYILDANDTAYTNMVGPLEKLSSIIKIFLIIVIITGSVIMVLLMFITTRERKFEVGILRALGVKRRNIVFQFIVETLIIVSLALVIGGFSGKIISQTTANYLIQRQITVQKEAQQENKNDFEESFFSSESSSKDSKVEAIDKIETQFQTKEVLNLICIGLLISSFGSIVSAYWIMKYEPMKILNNRV